MVATDVRFAEILAMNLAVRGAGMLIQPWLRTSVSDQQQRAHAGEPL
jgi:hypothetical protein